MIKTSIFCPYERIVSLLAYKSHKVATSVVVTFGFDKIDLAGFTERVVNKCNDPDMSFFTFKSFRTVEQICDGLNHALGFSESQRYWALNQRYLLFTVKYFKGDELIKQRSGYCDNCLYTLPGVSSKGSINSVGNTDYCHVEALTTYANNDMRANDRQIELVCGAKPHADDYIPYCNYIGGTKKGELIVVEGPAVNLTAVAQYEFTHDGRKIRVFKAVDGIQADELPQPAVLESSVRSQSPVPEVLVKTPNGKVARFELGQTSFVYEGVPISPIDALAIIKSVVKYETCLMEGLTPRALVGGNLVFELRKAGDVYKLTFEEQEVYENDVAQDEVIRELFKRISASEQGLYVNVNGRALLFAGEKTASCYVMALTYALALHLGLSYYNFIQVLDKLAAKGYIAEGGTGDGYDFTGRVVGATARYTAKDPMKLVITDDRGRVRSLNFFRKTLSKTEELPGDATPIIVGLDPNPDASSRSGPDHYVIGVFTKEGRLVLLYNPLKSATLLPGVDITECLRHKDTEIYQLEAVDE